jgi:hypothetical protein
VIPEPAHRHCQQLFIQDVSKNAQTDSLKLLDSVSPTHELSRPAKRRRLELIVRSKSRLRSPLYNSKSYLDATDKR